MIDERNLLERELHRFEPQPGLTNRVYRRRDQKQRNRRIRAGVLGLAIAIGVGWLGVNAIRSTPSVPANDPPSRFVGEWVSTDYNDNCCIGTTASQTMTILAEEDGVLHVTVHDDSACVPDDTAQTMTGSGRLEDPTTLVVPSPDLTCVDGNVGSSDRVDTYDGYTLVLDLATDRLYDSLGVVWNRGAPEEGWPGPSTEAGVDG